MKKIILLICMLSLLALSGCRAVIRGGHHYTAPPVHAPAHGHRQLHHYQYYPGAEFYFDVSRDMYFYLDSRGEWSFSVNLPHHLRGYLDGGYVDIEMKEARPYLRHKHHRNKYRNHKYKNKHKRKHKRKNRYNNGHSSDNEHRYKKKRSYRKDHKSKKNAKHKYKEKNKRSKKDKYKNGDDDYDEKKHKKNRRNGQH